MEREVGCEIVYGQLQYPEVETPNVELDQWRFDGQSCVETRLQDQCSSPWEKNVR